MRIPLARLRAMSRRQIYCVVTLVLLVVAVAVLAEYRHFFYPKRFRIVASGAIYRGGRQTTPVLRRIIRKHGIRTIVNLDDKVTEKDGATRRSPDRYAVQKTMARDSAIQYHGFSWGGDGIGPFEEYDAVADILATTSSHPVFVHCAAGENRTNAAVAAYWIRHLGYSLERAVDRLRLEYGLVPEEKMDFVRHLREYCEHARSNPQSH